MKRKSKAVLAVETALVLPVVLFAALAFCYLFQVMEFQLRLQAALNRTAEQTASYGYLLGRMLAVTEQKAEDIIEQSGLLSGLGMELPDDAGEWMIRILGSEPAETALKKLTEHYMDVQDAAMLRVTGGWGGVDFSGSCIKDETRCVVVTAEYSIRVPFVPGVFSAISFRQTAVCRLFCGDRDYVPKGTENAEQETEKGYFVTPNGSVYHARRDCRYLEINVLAADKESMAKKRNLSGGKYYPCKLCALGEQAEGILYYTKSGSSYHITKNCSSLSRTVIQKTADEIAGMPPCSVCGQGE